MNRPIRVVLVSRSKLFLEGAYKLLEHENNINIITEALNSREIKEYITKISPEFIFLDNRSLKLNVHKLLNLIAQRSPNTKIILFSNHIGNEPNSPDVIHISEKTSSSELIQTIKTLGRDIQAKQTSNTTKHPFTQTVAKRVKL